MYNRHFGLNTAPFRITPDTQRFFTGGQRAEVLETIQYAITNGEGMVKVTGEIGTGKTMLCRMLQDRLPDSVEVVYLANPSLTRDEVLVAIAMDLGLPVPAHVSHLMLQQQLHTYLLEAHRQHRQVVIFIEEAQRMPLETLEEIRLLSNLETRQAKLLQLVLFGQPELDRLLGRYQIRQLKDRITHCFNLRPLSASEVRDYVRFRLHSAGFTGNELFSSAAYRQLAWSSRGLIRRIHVLAEKALLAAFASGSQRVHWHHVWRARGDGQRRISLLGRMSTGLLSGVLAGAALAVVASQFVTRPTGELAETDPARALESQKIDETLRTTALQIQPAAGMPLVSQRLQASNRWLSRPVADTLTIQLLLTEDDDLENLEKVLGKQTYRDLLPQLYLYRSEVNGRLRWNLLYGEFDTKTQALSALAELPGRVRLRQPFLRSLGALRTSHQAAHGPAIKEGRG